MTLETALAQVRTQVARSSQGRVAQRIGVSTSSLSRWLNGLGEPEGKARERLFAWAATVGADPAPVADIPPVHTLFQQFMASQSRATWAYTLNVMRAMTEQLAAQGPPDEGGEWLPSPTGPVESMPLAEEAERLRRRG